MKALVTGGAGFIGSHVVRELLAAGREPRVLVFPGEDTRNIEGLDVERVQGDVRDAGGVRRAVEGCDLVFHLAAIYALWLPEPRRMVEVNVEGTRNVLGACLDAGVRRVVYTSSIAVFGGQGPDRDATEESPFALGVTGDLYCLTKFDSHQVALDYARRGLDVVIVAPCGPFGPGDVGPTPTGRFLASLFRGPVSPIIDSINNLVDVRDVAKGHLLAAERGRTGESYLLGNENVRQAEMARMALEIAGVGKPLVRVPFWLARGFSHCLLLRTRLFTHKAPLFTPAAIEVARRGLRADCSKAFRELGLPRTPLRETLRDAIVWFARNGYLTDPRAARNLLG